MTAIGFTLAAVYLGWFYFIYPTQQAPAIIAECRSLILVMCVDQSVRPTYWSTQWVSCRKKP